LHRDFETIAFRLNQRRIRAVKSLYEKTIAFVLQYIDEQKLREGDQLPTEAQLSALAGVSLVTVRRALSELSSQAVVRREQGRGTFVARPRVKAETTKIGGLRNGLHLDSRSKLQTRVLSCVARASTEEEAKRLGLSSDKRSLYDLLDEVYGLKEAREEQTLVSRPALTREHELLDLMSFEWVVEVSGVSFSARHQPIDAFRMVFVAKSFAFRLETAPTFFVEAVEVIDVQRARKAQ
jgi:DNA-binding GntR family transcriptional regulator